MDEKDNRMNILNTTQAGRELLGKTWKQFTDVDVRMFDGFCPEELMELKSYYERIQANLERINGEMDEDDGQ